MTQPKQAVICAIVLAVSISSATLQASDLKSGQQPASASKQSPAWPRLKEYQLCFQKPLTGVRDNASGVTYDPTDGTFWVVAKTPRALTQYDAQFNELRTFNLSGKVHDPEGIVWIHGKTFALVEENQGQVLIIKLGFNKSADNVARCHRKHKTNASIAECAAKGTTYMQYQHHPLHVDGFKESVSNKGLEGIAYDASHDIFYVAQEEDPRSVRRVQRDGIATVLFQGDGRLKDLHDYSDMYYAAPVDSLFILSQKSRTVQLVSLDGKVLDERTHVAGPRPELPDATTDIANLGPNKDVLQIEMLVSWLGLTFTTDGQVMVIVSEPRSVAVYAAEGGGGCQALTAAKTGG